MGRPTHGRKTTTPHHPSTCSGKGRHTAEPIGRAAPHYCPHRRSSNAMATLARAAQLHHHHFDACPRGPVYILLQIIEVIPRSEGRGTSHSVPRQHWTARSIEIFSANRLWWHLMQAFFHTTTLHFCGATKPLQYVWNFHRHALPAATSTYEKNRSKCNDGLHETIELSSAVSPRQYAMERATRTNIF